MEISLLRTELQLAARAEADGDLARALTFLERAHAAARTDKRAHARVHWLMARFHARRRQPLRVLRHVSLVVLASAFARR